MRIAAERPAVVVGAELSIRQLVQAIQEEHEAGSGLLRKSLRHYRKAGEYLIQAKSRLPPGRWKDWLKENLGFTQMTANNYMRVARNWSLVKSAGTLVKAIQILRDIRRAEEAAMAETEGGPEPKETPGGDGGGPATKKPRLRGRPFKEKVAPSTLIRGRKVMDQVRTLVKDMPGRSGCEGWEEYARKLDEEGPDARKTFLEANVNPLFKEVAAVRRVLSRR